MKEFLKKYRDSIISGILTGAILGVISTYTCEGRYSEGYKQGQLDALNGKIKYVLEKQNNNEMIWKEKK